MNRREFMQRMLAAGLVMATPKIIFDMGANSYKLDSRTKSILETFFDTRILSIESLVWAWGNLEPRVKLLTSKEHDIF